MIKKPSRTEFRNVLGHFKHMYFYELHRREQMEKRSQFLIPVIAGLLAAIFLLTSHVSGEMSVTFALLLFFTLAFVGGTMYWTGLYLWPQQYQTINSSEELKEIFLEENKETPCHFEEALLDQYAEATDYNQQVNDRRNKALSMSTKFLALTVLSVSLLILYQILKIVIYT